MVLITNPHRMRYESKCSAEHVICCNVFSRLCLSSCLFPDALPPDTFKLVQLASLYSPPTPTLVVGIRMIYLLVVTL